MSFAYILSLISYLYSLLSRMKPQNSIAQIFPVNMGINFGSSNAGMAQHFLHGTQVGAAFHQMRGKRMAERMRTDMLIQSRFLF